MKYTKDAALMALGATALFAYQKYNKPVMKKVEKGIDNTMKSVNAKIEDMM
ncbi:MAG: hypothetical protein R3Y21_02565 [Mycoplasmatota bacterium]